MVYDKYCLSEHVFQPKNKSNLPHEFQCRSLRQCVLEAGGQALEHADSATVNSCAACLPLPWVSILWRQESHCPLSSAFSATLHDLNKCCGSLNSEFYAFLFWASFLDLPNDFFQLSVPFLLLLLLFSLLQSTAWVLLQDLCSYCVKMCLRFTSSA